MAGPAGTNTKVGHWKLPKAKGGLAETFGLQETPARSATGYCYCHYLGCDFLVFLWVSVALAQNAPWPDWAHEHSRWPASKCQPCERDDQGHIARSRRARAAFKRNNPCPATAESKGPCPGYVIDHIKPLACGGEDAPDNMQWQTRAAARAKDRWSATTARNERSQVSTPGTQRSLVLSRAIDLHHGFTEFSEE